MKLQILLGIISFYLLFGFILIKTIFIWTDYDRDILLFGKSIKIKKIFRIEREMLGDHRKPFGIFSTITVIGVIILFTGLPFKSALFLKSGALLSGLSLIVYGTYGFYKKEIVNIGGISIDRIFGYKAFFDAIIYILLGAGMIATLVLADLFFKK